MSEGKINKKNDKTSTDKVKNKKTKKPLSNMMLSHEIYQNIIENKRLNETEITEMVSQIPTNFEKDKTMEQRVALAFILGHQIENNHELLLKMANLGSRYFQHNYEEICSKKTKKKTNDNDKKRKRADSENGSDKQNDKTSTNKKHDSSEDKKVENKKKDSNNDKNIKNKETEVKKDTKKDVKKEEVKKSEKKSEKVDVKKSKDKKDVKKSDKEKSNKEKSKKTDMEHKKIKQLTKEDVMNIKNINVEAPQGELPGLSQDKAFDCWRALNKKLDINYLFNIKKYGFAKSKLLAAQLICTKLLDRKELALNKDELINIFKELNEKYLDEESRFQWVDDIKDQVNLSQNIEEEDTEKKSKKLVKNIKKEKFLALKKITLLSENTPLLGVTFQKVTQKWAFKNNQFEKTASYSINTQGFEKAKLLAIQFALKVFLCNNAIEATEEEINEFVDSTQSLFNQTIDKTIVDNDFYLSQIKSETKTEYKNDEVTNEIAETTVEQNTEIAEEKPKKPYLKYSKEELEDIFKKEMLDGSSCNLSGVLQDSQLSGWLSKCNKEKPQWNLYKIDKYGFNNAKYIAFQKRLFYLTSREKVNNNENWLLQALQGWGSSNGIDLNKVEPQLA